MSSATLTYRMEVLREQFHELAARRGHLQQRAARIAGAVMSEQQHLYPALQLTPPAVQPTPRLWLIPRADVGRDYLPKSLEDAGARVDVVTAYRTVVPENVDRGRLSAMLTGSADCIAFMSSSSVKNLGLLFDTHDLGEKLHGLTIACIGDVTAATAADYGLRVDIQPQETTATALATAIAAYYSTHK